jgi:predicted Rossmann fold nucleotide-binding protein DprA/Smf involved in DNA uptake
MLLRLGAAPVRDSKDVLEALGFETEENLKVQKDYSNCSEEEKLIIEILKEPMSRDDLIRKSEMSASQANAILSVMEIKGIIKESMGEIRLD